MHATSPEGTLEKKTRRVLSEIFAGCPLESVGVRLWDDTAWPDDRPRSAILVLKHPGALSRMFLPGTEVGLAEAYLDNDFDIEGDIEAAFEVGDFLLSRLDDWKKKLKLVGLLTSINHAVRRLLSRIPGKRHSPERDRRAVTFHYDVSNDFYQLWLDRRMVYSCAYFKSPCDYLDIAQEQKLDYICRKLRLRAGQRLLDIGCGWGALVIHAAKHFRVHAEGITNLPLTREDWYTQNRAEGSSISSSAL